MAIQAVVKTLFHLFPEKMGKALISNNTLTNPEVAQTARSTIAEYGLNPDTITILNARMPESPAIAIGGNVLALDESTCKDYSSEELRFIIGHELTHLQNKDMLKMGLLAFCLPFVAHFGLKAWDSAFKKTIATIKQTFSVTKEGTIDQTLTKLQNINSWLSTFCLTKGVVAMQLFNAYSRYCEKQADITSITRLNAADGAVKCFERFQEKMKVMREESPINKFFITPEGDARLDFLHPPLSERIAYTQELIATS